MQVSNLMLYDVYSIQKKAWLGDGHKQWLTDGERNEGHAWQFSDDVNSPSARDEPLKGFSWKGGTSKVTTGIFMWSKPFILTEPETGEKVTTCFMNDTLYITHTNISSETL